MARLITKQFVVDLNVPTNLAKGQRLRIQIEAESVCLALKPGSGALC